MPLAAGTRLGPYEVLGPLGAGGMGEVYRARDLRLGRTVALKILPPELAADPVRRARFEREARALSSVNHPHVAALYDVGEAEGLYFLVLEQVEGETLAAALLEGPVPSRRLLPWAEQMADALDAAHRAGVVHRDLKPSNVLLTRTGVKLIDFGIALAGAEGDAARDRSGAAPTETLDSDPAPLGTLGYMAPEQLERKAIDARADLFALGVVLYEMATGRRPFVGESRAALVAATLTAEPPALSVAESGLPARLEGLILRCLEKDPDERWQSAADLRLALQWLGEERAAAWGPDPRRARGWLLPLAVGCGAGALVAILALGGVGRHAGSPRSTASPSPVRFEVAPPPGTSFSLSGNPMALSPDGETLAFVAGREGEPERLWIRPLDSVEATELAGTEHAGQPFWSTDGRSLGFLVGSLSGGIQEAKAIDLDGTGRAARVLDRGGGIGAAWGPRGLLILAGPGRGLRALATGAATPGFVAPALASEREFHRWPALLPDGERFVFTVLSPEAARHGIHLASIDGAVDRRLFAASSNAQYVPPGYLLFGRGADLVAQPFDRKKLALAGEPVAIATPVAYNLATARHTFSASSSGVLAFRAEPSTQLVWYDRAGRRLGAPLPPGHYRDPALSRDGTRLAYSRLDPRSGTADIWSHDLVRGLSARRTFGASWDFSPLWQPDGDDLVYVARAADRYAFSIRRSAGGQAGGAGEPLLEDFRPIDVSDWLAGSDELIWSPRSRAATLNVLPLSGRGTPRSLSEPDFRESQGQVSPDGRFLAYVSTESGEHEVYLRELPAGEKLKVSDAGGIEPRWRADGGELFYLARDQRLTSVRLARPADGRIELSPPTPLFRTRLGGTIRGTLGRNQYDVAPDGERFLVNEMVADTPITVLVGWPATLPE